MRLPACSIVLGISLIALGMAMPCLSAHAQTAAPAPPATAIGMTAIDAAPAVTAAIDPPEITPAPAQTPPAPGNLPPEWETLLAKPGGYVWQSERAPEGQVLIVISLDQQRAHVYRAGIRIAATTISSDSKGRETPTGSFEILQKKVMHRSNLYDDAPMPFMQRLTWDGIALHAGRLPGYPASHGCIRLPRKFAELLYAATNFSTRVLVADASSDPTGLLVHPGDTAPVDAVTGVPQGAYAQALGEATNRYAMPMLSAAALAPGTQPQPMPAGAAAPAPAQAKPWGVPAFAKPIWQAGDDPAKRAPPAVPWVLAAQDAIAIGGRAQTAAATQDTSPQDTAASAPPGTPAPPPR